MNRLPFFIASLLTITLVLGAGLSFAKNEPPGPEVSPEVYKIRAENDQWRAMEATWQPGQEDNFHYHPGDRVSIFQTDCKLRLTKPDGTYKDVNPKAGKGPYKLASSIAQGPKHRR